MDFRSVICGAILVAVVLGGTSASALTPTISAMWVETNPVNPLSSDYSMDVLLDFAQDKGIGRIFLATYPFLEMPDSNWVFKPELLTFFGKAATAGITVDALLGDSIWADSNDPEETSYQFPRTLISDLLTANGAYEGEGGTGFGGIHLDLEYWTSAAYTGGTTAEKQQIEQNYLALLAETWVMTDAFEKSLNVDLAHWLDTGSARETQLSDIMDIVDEATILAYFDTHDAIFSASDDEMAMAAGKELPIYVGVLTLPVGGDIHAWNTFAGQDESEMYAELNLTEAMISGAEYNTFEGFAIYDYTNYVQMVVPEPATLGMACAGLMGLAGIVRRRMR